MKILISLSILASLLTLTSCDNVVDDQTILTPEQNKIVNPEASPRNFVENNSRHKVILAVMDTGIDYNHPLLKNNIHFSLDNDGNPTGSGWDFAGNDPWASPYVARTNFFNPLLPPEDQEKSRVMLDAHARFLTEYPDLSPLFPMGRNIEEEDVEGLDHGTHVAGLASYDSPEIGLRGYRVIPLNIVDSFEMLNGENVTKRFTKVLISGLEKAIDDGAKVINMSLGLNSEAKDSPSKKEIFEEFKQDLFKVVENHPEVIFVVAAGNDGKWVDGTSVSILPCFIPRTNVICVSALTEQMEPASFSNIINNKSMTTIFAWGEDILSAYPTQSCTASELDFRTIAIGPEELQKFGNLARITCAKDLTLKSMSGTSMASPIIARKVAKIRAHCLDCSVSEIKEKLFSSTFESSIDGLAVRKLPIEKPSWYSTSGNSNKSMTKKKWNFLIF